ncbi:MAG: hypothetical protein ACN6OP_29870, partial [Pseudomonadales bacterium]
MEALSTAKHNNVLGNISNTGLDLGKKNGIIPAEQALVRTDPGIESEFNTHTDLITTADQRPSSIIWN